MRRLPRSEVVIDRVSYSMSTRIQTFTERRTKQAARATDAYEKRGILLRNFLTAIFFRGNRFLCGHHRGQSIGLRKAGDGKISLRVMRSSSRSAGNHANIGTVATLTEVTGAKLRVAPV